MEKHLGQDEIDSLFASAREEALKEQAAAEQRVEPAQKAELYNFSRAGQISNEQMQAISTVNDLFARNLTHNLAAWLRTILRFGVGFINLKGLTWSDLV